MHEGALTLEGVVMSKPRRVSSDIEKDYLVLFGEQGQESSTDFVG